MLDNIGMAFLSYTLAGLYYLTYGDEKIKKIYNLLTSKKKFNSTIFISYIVFAIIYSFKSDNDLLSKQILQLAVLSSLFLLFVLMKPFFDAIVNSSKSLQRDILTTMFLSIIFLIFIYSIELTSTWLIQIIETPSVYNYSALVVSLVALIISANKRK